MCRRISLHLRDCFCQSFSSTFDFRLIEKVQQQGLYLFDTIPFFYQINLCIDLIQTMEKHGLEPSTNTFEPLIIFFARVLDMAKVASSILMKCLYFKVFCECCFIVPFSSVGLLIIYYAHFRMQQRLQTYKSLDWID